MSSMADSHSLDRPTAVVTNAHRGLGEAVARTLAASGFHVVLPAAEPDQCAELAATIGGTAVHVDVTSNVSVRSFAAQIPHSSVLVITGAEQPMTTRTEADTHDWRWRWETHILGTLQMVKALMPHLLDTDGVIVTISARDNGNPSGDDDSGQLRYSESTLHRLIAAEIDGTSVRFTRIGSELPEYPDSLQSVAANRTSLIVQSQMAPGTAHDVAEVVCFIATRPLSMSAF